jgi:hypothetical protein
MRKFLVTFLAALALRSSAFKHPSQPDQAAKKESGAILEKVKQLEAHLAGKVADAATLGQLFVNGPLPADFAERFSQAVAQATGAGANTVKFTGGRDADAGIVQISFEAPADVVKTVENDAADPSSKLASGGLHSFLVAKEESAPAPATPVAASPAATPVEEKGIDIDTQMPYGDLEPFGREDTAQELTERSVLESNSMVDQLERAEVAEEKRATFRALTRLRGAAITSFDGVARSQTGNIDEYNKVHKWRKTHPLHHLADEESDVSKWAFPDNADLLQTRHTMVVPLRVRAALMDTSSASSLYSKEVMEERVRDFKAINPGFSEETCAAMYSKKKSLGGAVPPTDFVVGCNEVCDAARDIKEYWGSGDMASYACGQVKSYGCVYDGTPPVTDIGC